MSAPSSYASVASIATDLRERETLRQYGQRVRVRKLNRRQRVRRVLRKGAEQ